MIPVDREEKRRLILKAALAVFARKGYERATISDIAQQADIGKGVLYDYFKSKEDLFVDLFEYIFPQNVEFLQPRADSPLAPVEEIEAISAAILAHYESLGQFFNVIAQFWAQGQSEMASQRFSQSWGKLYGLCRGKMAECVERGKRSGVFRPDVDPALAGWTIVAVVDGGILQWLHGCAKENLAQRGMMALRITLRGMMTESAIKVMGEGSFSFEQAMTDRSVAQKGMGGA